MREIKHSRFKKGIQRVRKAAGLNKRPTGKEETVKQVSRLQGVHFMEDETYCEIRFQARFGFFVEQNRSKKAKLILGQLIQYYNKRAHKLSDIANIHFTYFE